MNLNLSASLNVFKLITRPSLCLPHHTVSSFNDLPIPLNRAFEKEGKHVDIRVVVLDKDDCFAFPESSEVYGPYKVCHCCPRAVCFIVFGRVLTPYLKQHFEDLRSAYPGRRLLIVSNTAGATSYDSQLKLAAEVEASTGITVLPHRTKKPGCGPEIMDYFKAHPETGVTNPSHVAIVGDRLSTDIMMANMMGSWGFWVRDGVVPMQDKSVVSLPSSPLPSNLVIFVFLVPNFFMIHLFLPGLCHSRHDADSSKFSRMERRLAPFLLNRGYHPDHPPSPFE